ncbi:bacterioferritin [Aliidiomarina shirensis]|uniref:Bacterioferritin n=1 Tax=Aliidiomarina shirensis TaxID=1048642 RepID=A0A432WSV7_9GAMM|nr:bacterioferritin [Aliidiomarina shirensis]RUO36834.1 bacterioferritin [Aliidiomarina shirensis]
MTNVVNALNGLLAWELTSIDQYTAHSEQYEDWGFNKLFERISHEADDERGHAKLLIERILYLGGKPDLETRHALPDADNVAEMLAADLDLERQNATALKSAIELCEQQRDFVSRDMLVGILKDTEEDHAYWLRQQLGLIHRLGLEKYLQAMM